MRPCAVTPAMILYFAWKARPGYGWEKLFLQGLWVPPSLRETCGLADVQIADLAGNAFCLASATPILLVVQLISSYLTRLIAQRRVEVPVPRAPAAPGVADDEGDDWAFMARRARRRRLV